VSGLGFELCRSPTSIERVDVLVDRCTGTASNTAYIPRGLRAKRAGGGIGQANGDIEGTLFGDATQIGSKNTLYIVSSWRFLTNRWETRSAH